MSSNRDEIIEEQIHNFLPIGGEDNPSHPPFTSSLCCWVRQFPKIFSTFAHSYNGAYHVYYVRRFRAALSSTKYKHDKMQPE